MHVAEATLSPSSNFIIFTPWVARESFGIWEILVLITFPFWEITIKSSLSNIYF